MRFIFSMKGLLVIVAVVFLIGHLGLSSLAQTASVVSETVRKATSGSASQTQPAARAEAATSSEPDQRINGGNRQADARLSLPPRSPNMPDLAEYFRVGRRPVTTAPAGVASGAESEQQRAALKQTLQRIDYREKPNGVFDVRTDHEGFLLSIMAKATATVPTIAGTRGQRMALDRSRLLARASIAHWLESHLIQKVTEDGEFSFRIQDSNAGTEETAEESASYATTTVQTAQAILRGLVAVHEEVITTGDGQEAITVVGFNTRTLAAAMSAQGRLEPIRRPSSSDGPSTPTPRMPVAEQIRQTPREDLIEMGF